MASDSPLEDRLSTEDLKEPPVDELIDSITKAVGEHPVCPMCGESVWRPIRMPIALPGPPHGKIVGPGHRARALYCVGCHFMRLHYVSVPLPPAGG